MLKGFKTYRHATNPTEKQLHDSFIEQHNDQYMDLIVFPQANDSNTIPEDYLSDREKQIVVSTIQWLGSPVGKIFLSENGFTQQTKPFFSEVKSEVKQIKKKYEVKKYLVAFLFLTLGLYVGFLIWR